MPKCLHPGQRYPIVLDCDQDLPKGSQPTFYAKAQSMIGQERIGELVDRWSGKDESELTRQQLFSEGVELLSDIVIDWKNMNDPDTGEPIPFAPESIMKWLTYLEVRELIRKVMFNSHIDPDTKKNLESPPSSGEENCAPIVDTASA